ncbi:LOW QUALITY PROTEIN: integrin alpha-E [Pterocles gutturalis]
MAFHMLHSHAADHPSQPSQGDGQQAGSAFGINPSDCSALAVSGPDGTNVFQVTNCSALDRLLSTLQQSTIGVEGTQGDALERELTQAGFNVQILDTVSVLHLTPLNGGVLCCCLNTLNAPGYSMAVVDTECGPLVVYSMRGKVVVFQDGHLKQALQGEQVGSYFGSELCPLDVNHDGVTDLLLVGAPFYHIRGEDGRVYVYRLETETGSFTLTGHGKVQVTSPFAGFGFSNGDGYEDTAAGAPLDDQLSQFLGGSFYIFNGDKDKIKSSSSQRVKSSEISSGLQYFGQSIDGGFDFTNDGLLGSLENVMVLCLRPVIHFLTSMRFNPERILIFQNNSIVTAKLFDTISALPVSQEGDKWEL